MRVWSLSKKDNSSILFRQKMDNRCNICQEYTMPRNEKETRFKGWILKNTRIGPVLNIKVCYHDDRYSIEVQIPSLFEDNTFSWVRIVNCVDTYVTESMLIKKEEDIASGNPIAEARPRQKPTGTLTSVSIPVLERQWIDIETQRSHDHKCYEVSKAMTRLLRHDQSVPRGSDGAIHHSDIIDSAGGRSSTVLRNGYLKIWNQLWQKEEERRRDFNTAWIQTLPINSCTFEQFKDIQEIMILILQCKTMYCNRKDLPSTSTTSGTRVKLILIKKWINSRRKKPQERKTCGVLHYSESDGWWTWYGGNSTRSDETKDRANKNTWKRLRNTVCLVQFETAHEKGLQVHQTQSHAVVLCNTLPAACIEKAVCMKTQDELYQKVRLTPRVTRVVLILNSQFGQQDLQS